jgi:hypothetical protein
MYRGTLYAKHPQDILQNRERDKSRFEAGV